ncbi:MAG: tRNA epoxyqueuosine(34) reductase QueG [Bacteriovoracaceae bacterium]
MKPHFFPEELLKDLGVVDWGYTEDSLPTSFEQFDEWTKKEHHGPLNYLNDHRKELRKDLKQIFPEFQSALVFLFSYKDSKKWLLENQKHEIAGYALGFGGEDYHHALKRRLLIISDYLKFKIPHIHTFVSLDTQPILERDLAFRAGLGWFGKNSMLIHRREGSYFIIGSLLLNHKIDISPKIFETDHCGQCTACIEACPTKAIDPEKRTLIAEKCISTFTIETFKDTPPPQGYEASRGEIFGCDICQDVCPWNRRPLIRAISKLHFKETYQWVQEWFLNLSKDKLFTLIEAETNRGLKKRFFGTPFDRPGREGWLKNLKAKIKSSQNDP